MREYVWRTLTLALVVGIVLSMYGAVYFDEQASSLQSQNSYLKSVLSSVSETTDIGIDFGNGTRIWYNDTVIPVGASVYNATYAATGGRMTSQAYTFGNTSELFVTGILGVSGNTTSYWLWYYYDNSTMAWVEAPVGADSFLAVEGGVYLWNFTS